MLLVTLVALGCRKGSASSRSIEAPAPPDPASWTYEVRLSGGSHLAIEADLTGTNSNVLGVDDPAAPFVSGVEYAAGGRWAAAESTDGSWRVPCNRGCRVRYAFDLASAADRIRDMEIAGRAGKAIVAPPSSWLLRPTAEGSTSRAGRFRFRVTTDDPRERFATGIRAAADGLVGGRSAADGAAQTFEASLGEIDSASFAVFGHIDVAQVIEGSAHVDVAIAPDGLPLTRDETLAWVRRAVSGIAAYYGRFPVSRTLVIVVPGKAPETRGVTLGDGGPAVLVETARSLTAAATADDWVLTHELLHVTLPTLGRAHAWLEEGIATYVEPIVRARAGLVTPERYWRELAAGLRQGQPERGDEGLERTHTWGRTYWGGALFCFEADVRIRERTRNERSFDDVLRGIAATGDDVEKHWDIARFIGVGDAAVGQSVLADLYRERALTPAAVDLESLWSRLGVSVRPGPAVPAGGMFDENAPLAAVRRAITLAPPPRTGPAIGD
jgi:hypothetical protein